MDNQCQLTVKYTEGSSWTAYEHEDNLWFGSSSNSDDDTMNNLKYSAPTVFGCQIYESGLFRTQYEDGILGLALHRDTMITSTFKKHGSIKHNSFSICPGGDNNSKEKGLFSLGGVSSDVNYEEPMQYTNIVTNPNGWYVVHIDSVYVGNHSIFHHSITSNILRDSKYHQEQIMKETFNTEDRGTIIDSGTTDIYLPVKISQNFKKLWESYARQKCTNDNMSLSYEEYRRIPSVTLVLQGGYKWVLQPQYYLEPIDNRFDSSPWIGKKDFINRIYLDEPNGAVLGLNAMRGHNLYFDVEENRIGFARSSCEIIAGNG